MAALLAALLLAGAAPRLAAQQAPAPRPDASALMADRLVTLMHRALAGSGAPSRAQLLRARYFLDEALRLTPQDAELWRLRAELAERLDDEPGRIEAVRRYAQLQPRDDAAQLQVVLDSLRRYQTLQQRVEALERVLDNAQSARVTSALRSRLASHVAELALENGDMARFASRLKQAVQLDTTNAHAAGLVYDLADVRGAAPVQLAAALMTLVEANPADVSARTSLGSLLLSQGLYALAAEQYGVAAEVGTASNLFTAGDPASAALAESVYSGLVIGLAGSRRQADALRVLDQLESAMQPPPAPGADPAAPPARRVELPSDLELLRLAILQQQEQIAEADAAFARLRDRLRARAQAGDAQAAVDLAWLTALFGRDVQHARDFLEQQAQAGVQDDRLTRLVRGWLALRRGEMDAARDALQPLVEQDPFAALGVALSLDRAAMAERLTLLERTVTTAPGTLAGLMAAMEMAAAGGTVQATPQAAGLARRMSEWRPALRDPKFLRTPWTLLQVSVSEAQHGYLEPIVAEVTLRNASDLPLSLGEGGTIPSRLFVFLRPRRGTQSVPMPPPLVVDVGRRLRLEPRESLTVPTRLDRGELGALLAESPGQPIIFGATAVLDPQSSPTGGVTTGPLGAVATAPLIERSPTPATPANVDAWLRLLDNTTDGRARMRVLALLVQTAAPPAAETRPAGGQPQPSAEAARAAEAVGRVFPRLSPMEQAWVVSFVPAQPGHAALRQVLDAAERSDEPMVRIVYLSTHVTAADSPSLFAALRHSDRQIRDYAEAFRASLGATTQPR